MRNVMRLVSELMPIKQTVERPSGTLTIMMTYITLVVYKTFIQIPLLGSVTQKMYANINFEI